MRSTFVFACALALVACARGSAVPGDAAATAASPDSLRGIVRAVGSDPGGTLALLVDDGRRAVELRGPLALLERVEGLEVVVRGVAEPGGRLPGGSSFRVDDFAVRASGGVPAEDGTLVREGERYLLATHDRRRIPLEHVPAALRGRAGARVWISGTPGRFPDAFGIIAERP